MGASFLLPRPLLLTYAGLALAFSAVLLRMGATRGSGELVGWLVAYAAMGAASLRWPRRAPLAAGFAAFALGFVRTWRHGPTLDLGLGLVCLSLAVHVLDRARDRSRRPQSDLAGLLLLGLAAWSVLSLGFTLARLRGFAPAPGFGYHVYRFNPAGLSSEEALLRAVIGGACVFTWYGLYECARRADLARRPLALAVFALLATNAAALLVQAHVAERFLHPAGLPPIGRLNGVTSFCYALGDGLLALFLLLPAWGSRSGRPLALTVASLVLLLHGIAASGSRTPLAGMTLALFLWLASRVFESFRAGQRRRGLRAVGGLGLALAALTVAYWLTPSSPAGALGRVKHAVERQGVLGHLFETRFSSYPLIFGILREYPLAGVGVGLYQPEVDKQRTLLTPGLRTDRYLLGSYAPNQFLNTGAELGIPAMLALAAVFLLSAIRGLASPERRDFGLGVLVLGVALQFGPGFYNSEALVFYWLLIGLAAGPFGGGEALSAGEGSRRFGPRQATALLACALVLGVAGQILHRPALAIDSQWRRLRWRMNIGIQPPELDGRWTAAEATFSVDTDACALLVRWHAGDPRARDYRANVTFYVDGVAVERSTAVSGRIRESRLALPSVRGFKRISVRVTPPFVPARFLGGGDHRQLGVFLHSETPLEATAGGCPR